MSRRFEQRRGMTLVTMVILLPVVLAVAAFCINVAYIELTRTQLQTTSDVIARAAGRTLALTEDTDAAQQAANRLRLQNNVGGKVLPSSAVDLTFLASSREKEGQSYDVFDDDRPNAVQVNCDATSARLKAPFPTFGTPLEIRVQKSATSTQLEVNIVFVADRSGSMALTPFESSGTESPYSTPNWSTGRPVPPDSRWYLLMRSVDDVLSVLDESQYQERAALVNFGSISFQDTSLDSDFGAIRSKLRATAGSFLGGRTSLGDGITEGVATLANVDKAHAWATRLLIVISDGHNNIGADAIMAAQQATQKKVLICTVSVSADADTELLEAIAATTGGVHVSAVGTSDLSEPFESILRRLPTLLSR